MLKKILLLSIAIGVTSFSYGQRSKLREANRELNSAQEALILQQEDKALAAFIKAKEAIDLAVDNEPTATDAKAWLAKANIYVNMQDMEAYQNEDLYEEAIKAVHKALELNPKLENSDEITLLFYQTGIAAYNKGISAYNESRFQDSYKNFHGVLKALGDKPSDRFEKYPNTDTIRSNSTMLLGFNAYYLEKDEEVIKILTEASQDPILDNQPNIYLILYQVHERKGNKEQQLATIQEAIKRYPDDENMKRLELNYYIESGNQSEMIKKLEESAAADPNNAELHFNLGIVYAEMAQPAETGKYPEKADEYNQKAEQAYRKTLEIDQNDGKFNYQFGAFYFNRAVEYNKEMNDLPLTEKVKMDELSQKRDEYFEKAIPFLEKSRSIYKNKSKELESREKTFYMQALQALSRIYATQNELEKANELRVEMDGI